MERYVYVMNSDKYSNANVDYTFANKGNAFTGNLAFKNTSVNPIIKCTNIAEEHNGVSANFFEIRNNHYNGRISNDSNTAIVNRVFPSNNAVDIGYYGTNKQQTASFKIRTHSSTSDAQSNTFSNQLLIGSSSINMDLDSYDYFVLINPEISHGSSDKHPASRPHFAKITDIISFDEYGDGFEFEPKYPEALSKNTNFEIYKGPAVNDTSVIAVSYGLRGDGNEINPNTSDDTNFDFITDKYDGSNEVSRPTWYFYNDRLQNENQLDFNTKYNLTTCRCWDTDFAPKGSYYNASSDTQFASATLNWNPVGATLLKGQSVFSADKTYLGNVTATTSNTITLDYARETINGITALNSETLYVGRTIHQSVFRTEREFGTAIKDYGTLNQDAVLVDNMHIKDGELGSSNSPTDYELDGTYSFNPAYWNDAFRNARRHSSDLNSNTETNNIHGNLSGPIRYLHYKKSNRKNNAINPILEANVNSPKNKISQLATTKLLDNNGIQFLKVKENSKYTISSSIHTSNTKEIKLPYPARSNYVSSGPSFQIILINMHETDSDDWTPNKDYGLNDVLNADSIIRIKDTYYRIGTISATANHEQVIAVTHKKDIKDKKWTTLASQSHLDIFTSEDVYLMPFNGGLNTKCPIDTEAVYETISGTKTLQRLTMNENTISTKENSLYKKKLTLLNPEFYGMDIDINYGDKIHEHIKLLTTKVLYQPTPVHYMYYYKGAYCIEKDVFKGLVEDIESKNQDGIITYTITGRDDTAALLNGTINKNLNRSNDIIYSTIAPVFDAPTTTVTRHSITSAGVLTLTGTVAVEKYDLFLNSNGELIGEAVSDTASGSNTAVTLGGFDFTKGQAGTNTLYHIKTFGGLENYLTGTKAISANIKQTKHPTDFSSVGSSGLIFNDGEKIEYSSSFSFSNLLNTSATGSYDIDNTIGYDISKIKSIEENSDSAFALKPSRENKASIEYNKIHTVSSMYFNVLSINTSRDENTSIRLAPSFPVVLGSIDTNTSDSNGYGSDMRYLYMVNSNIPSGGFIHSLQNDPTTFYTPENTFRYWGLQRFQEGTIKETHDTVYDNSSKTQRITAASPMYKVNTLGEKQTPASGDLTPGLKPLSGSNIWSGTDLGLTGNKLAPVEYWDSAKITTHWNQLENIDYRCKNYQLLATGDIYPDSKLRWNNLQFNTKDFDNYGIMLKNEGSDGSSVSHENFTGTNTQTDYRDSDYERIEITSSNKTTNQLKRFGVMRLVEATFDWHMNPVDYESLPDNDVFDKITTFKYPRMKIIAQGSITDNGIGGATLDSSITFAIDDVIYKNDGTIVGRITSNTGAGSSSTIHALDMLSVTYEDEIYVVRQKLFSLYADPDWGMDTLNNNDFRMIYNYIIVPGINKDYLQFRLLESGGDKFDAQNTFIPIISSMEYDSGEGNYDDYYSLFHQAKHWDSGTTNPIWYHPSKIINALAYPTTRDDTPANTLVEDGSPQYKISNKVNLFGDSTMLFKGMKTSTQNDETAFTKPTSAIVGDGTHGTLAKWISYADLFTMNLEQRAKNITMQLHPGDKYALCGTKTVKHIYSESPNDRDFGGRVATHETASDNSGQLFQAQTVIKPRLTLTASTNYGKNITSSNGITLDDNSNNNWLDFAPNLEGYYLVSDKINDGVDANSDGDFTDADDTPHSYLPNKYVSTNQIPKGEPIYIGKITSHTTDTNGNYTRHNIKVDNDINTTTVGYTFRLMRISETTFEDTPDYFELNKMFDTGLKYDVITQNFTTTEEDSGGSEAETEYLTYQEGLYAMYLLLDIDTFNTHIDRRTLNDAKATFNDGDSLECFITDGKNKIEKNLIVSKTTNNLRFSYDGKLTGYGVVSFGEIFNIESSGTPDNKNPIEAFIGTTISIGTDAEQAMVEILEENEIKVDNTIKNITYTGNIVDSDTTGTSIALTTSHSNIALGDIIYNQDGRLIGKVTTANAGSSLSVSNIYYKPKKNDELVKYERKPFILNTNFNEQDVFSSLNYLGAKQNLDYKFVDDKIQIKDMENYSSKRRFSLKYRDGSNLISVDSNKSLFDRANKIVVIGDNVKAEVEIPSKIKRTIRHLDANIKNTEEARIKAHSILEVHRKDFKKITLTMERTGFELMEAGDIIHLDFPNHNIPADDYIVFEIENVMSTISKITVGTFNKSIAERLSELNLQQNKGFTTLFTRNINKTLTGKVLIDNLIPKEKTLHYALTSTTGGSTLGFD